VRESGEWVGCEMLDVCELSVNSRINPRVFESIAHPPGER